MIESNTSSSWGETMLNRVAFVTGASRGIGRAISLTLCRAGFYIVVASPEGENNELVAEEIRAGGGEAMTLNLDVTSASALPPECRASALLRLQTWNRKSR